VAKKKKLLLLLKHLLKLLSKLAKLLSKLAKLLSKLAKPLLTLLPPLLTLLLLLAKLQPLLTLLPALLLMLPLLPSNSWSRNEKPAFGPVFFRLYARKIDKSIENSTPVRDVRWNASPKGAAPLKLHGIRLS